MYVSMLQHTCIEAETDGTAEEWNNEMNNDIHNVYVACIYVCLYVFCSQTGTSSM